ncbi:MAG: Hsp20 family protein [Vigna little leaf phytoplasma]|nr:Hsp20 family protein [Vigna little leaf phytoplasma]
MVLSLFDENQDLLENFFQDWKNASLYNSFQVLMKTDIKEYNDRYVLESELPGFKKENIKISLDNGILTVEAHPSIINDNKEDTKQKDPKEKFHYLRQERLNGIIKRSFNLGEEYSMEDIKGSLENGLLVIEINKKQQKPQPKQYLELK